jgi:hypothetical protein
MPTHTCSLCPICYRKHDLPSVHRNNKAPMPQIVANSSSSSASSAPLAAAAAALSQPTMRILKRPSASSSQASSPPPAQSATPPLAERQARYEAARQRIFADASSSPTSPASLSSSSSPAPSPAPSTAVRITREPHGPTAVATAGSASPNAKGFGHRRAPKPPKAAASP